MPEFQNLVEALYAAPADRPFVTHWLDEDDVETVTFGEFVQRSRCQARVLRRSGLTAGGRLIIIMPQGIPAMAAFVGAMMLGAVPALLAYPNFKVNPVKYRAGLAGVTENLKAHLVVVDRDFPDDLLGYVSLDDGITLLRASEGEEEVAASEEAFPEIALSSLAFIQHSAGTTGLQKGVALSHSQVLTQISHLASALRIDSASDAVYSWLPLYHDMGLIACFMLPMVCHLPVVMQSPLDWVIHPETMLRIVSDYRSTLAWLPNFAFQFVARRAPREQLEGVDLASLRALINCSEPVRGSSMDEFAATFSLFGLKPSALLSSYAMAENVFAVSQSELGRPEGPRCIWADGACFRREHIVAPVEQATEGALCFTSSGRLLPNTQVRIIAEDGTQLAPAKVGEIMVCSDSLFGGYFNRADLTADAISDGWFHTGDLGFFWDDELYVIGRKKDLIIVAGENLYPQDIEELVASHPAVHDGRAVAIGAYNPDLGTQDIVVVAEFEQDSHPANLDDIEREIRSLVVSGMGVAVKWIFLKPPNWIIKSTAGKPARANTKEKLLLEHPELTFNLGESKSV